MLSSKIIVLDDDPTGSQGPEVEDVPADEIQIVGINHNAYELRGRPELMDMLPWLKSYKDWLENRARQNHWRSTLVWWVSIATSIPSILAGKAAQYMKPPTPFSRSMLSKLSSGKSWYQ